MQTTPIVKDLVLIGGGHSHVEVLKRFGMRPIPGLRITVVSREVHTPYSGMLPGLIAGHYAFDDTHIDLGPLVRMAGGRLYHDEVVELDLQERRVVCADRPAIAYDVLSLDIGSAPDTRIPGAAEFAIPVKPVSNFNQRWDAARERILRSTGRLRIGVVGGGAGGIELLLAIRHHLRRQLTDDGHDPDRLTFVLVAASDEILPSHNARARRKFEQLLRRKNVELLLGRRVTEVKSDRLIMASGDHIPLDEMFWVTSASAAAWPGIAGLAVDGDGFIRVRATLESVSHPGVFACGDIAAVDPYPRPKSGVFAVRQGPPLAENLRRAVVGQALRPFKPQRHFLSLISTGDRHAIGSRGFLAIEGRRVWRLKDWIDRRFMQKYRELPVMPETRDVAQPLAAELNRLGSDPMRCGGCGAKIGADILSRALATLEHEPRDDVLIGLDQPDDAAVVVPRPGTVLVQTVDAFRAFIDDPFLFGKITANHCLSDIFAMGATPQTALAIVSLPLASAGKMRDDLVQLMGGALSVFKESGTALVGGHTNEASELTLGFAINGYIERSRLNRKRGVQAGDLLILTKPLGTGVLFAANMRGKAKSRWIEAALDTMLQSNAAAAACLHEAGANAMTDITGFGLAGHLIEMLGDGDCAAAIELAECPVLEGATQLAAAGYLSSLHPENLRAAVHVAAHEAVRRGPRFQLCFDPQTAGGLLGAIPPGQAENCLARLHASGYTQAAVIGRIDRAAGAPGVTITFE